MTFDEANKKLDEALDLVDYTFLPEHLDEILKNLKQEYEPTVEMTKKEKSYIVYYQSSSSFYSFMSDIINLDVDEYKELTEKQLMQAWLHPETIKIIDEEK